MTTRKQFFRTAWLAIWGAVASAKNPDVANATTDQERKLLGNVGRKAPVTALAASNITLSGEQNIDDVRVTVRNGAGLPDRVLCIGQTDAAQNGVYDVATGAWSRSLDTYGEHDLTTGSEVLVTQGTAYAGTYWRVSTVDGVRVGSTPVNWTQALTNFLTAGLVSELVSIYPNTAETRSFYASGYVTAGDQGGGNFYWDQSSTATHDGGAVIRPTAAGRSAGRWIRVINARTVNPEMWGAVAHVGQSDTSDSTAAVQAMFDFLPKVNSVAAPYDVLIPGRYGVSDTIIVRGLYGCVVAGVASFHRLASGFKWVGTTSAASLSKDFFTIEGCRCVTFQNFNVVAPEGATHHLRAAFGLSSRIDNGYNTQQEKLNFDRICIGMFDGFEGQGAYLNFQFTYGFWAYETGKQYGNNDFHEFRRCKILQCNWAFYNDTNQGVAWRTVFCLHERCDHGYYVRNGGMNLCAPEFLLCNRELFVITYSPDYFVTLRIEDLATEQNYGPLLKINGGAQVMIENGGIDCNVNPSNNATINPAFPHMVIANDNSRLDLFIANVTGMPRGFTGSLDLSCDNGSRSVRLVGVNKEHFPFFFRNASTISRYMVEYDPGVGTNSALTSYLPTKTRQLLHYHNQTLQDRHELDSKELYLGNSYYGAVARVRQIKTKVRMTAGALVSIPNFLPAGVLLLAPPSVLISNNLAGGCTGFQIGDGAIAARWGTHNASSDRATRRVPASDISNTTDAGPVYIKSNTDLMLTPTGAHFPAGTNYFTVTALVLDVAGKLYRHDEDGSA